MEKIQDIVIKAIMPDLNDNGMQISEDTVTNIIIDCKGTFRNGITPYR